MTDRDFEDLDTAIELAKDSQSNAIKRKLSKKSRAHAAVASLLGSDFDRDAPIDASSVELGVKQRLTKEERKAMFSSSSKRDEKRAKFGMNSREHAGGSSNADKERAKSFVLTRFSDRARARNLKSKTVSKPGRKAQRGRKRKGAR